MKTNFANYLPKRRVTFEYRKKEVRRLETGPFSTPLISNEKRKDYDLFSRGRPLTSQYTENNKNSGLEKEESLISTVSENKEISKRRIKRKQTK